MADQGFAPEYRIRKQRDFDRVFARRCSVADECLIIYGCENELPLPRLGIAVSRKLGKPVFRNRWKRLIREVFRQRKSDIPSGIDYVVVPKKGTEPDFHDLWKRLPSLMKQLARRLKRLRTSREAENNRGRPLNASQPSACAPSSQEGTASCFSNVGPKTSEGKLVSGADGGVNSHTGLKAQSEPGETTASVAAVPAWSVPTRQVGTMLENCRRSGDVSRAVVIARDMLRGIRRLGAILNAVLVALLVAIVTFYRWTISPLLGRCCRFEPSCSQYFILALRKYGVLVGTWKGICRILRCHPWHPGGYDPP